MEDGGFDGVPFNWRLKRNFLPIYVRLQRKSIILVYKILCCPNTNDASHIFFECPIIRKGWEYFGDVFRAARHELSRL